MHQACTKTVPSILDPSFSDEKTVLTEISIHVCHTSKLMFPTTTNLFLIMTLEMGWFESKHNSVFLLI